jgi:hypothetical protein
LLLLLRMNKLLLRVLFWLLPLRLLLLLCHADAPRRCLNVCVCNVCVTCECVTEQGIGGGGREGGACVCGGGAGAGETDRECQNGPKHTHYKEPQKRQRYVYTLWIGT